MRKIIRGALPFVLVFAVLCAAVFSAYGEHTAWDCPQCGRTGNTGNYCGGCGKEAPWISAEPEDPADSGQEPAGSVLEVTDTELEIADLVPEVSDPEPETADSVPDVSDPEPETVDLT